ncbi:MAG: asparagine synthase (glutamine-hydrolyzing) [Desulfomonilaceae bacterium]
MCGIAGIINLDTFTVESLRNICLQMTNSLLHRGPDDVGVWTDTRGLVALGHRRLSILDLSPEGHQPMLSSTGRYVISYNGEVYNYINIRKRLEERRQAPIFGGHSDTEVILAAIEAWGLEKAVQEFNGIFAFAIWDQKESRLSLVRDRVGVKPLYYGWAGKSFVFGSELKSLRQHPHFDNRVDRKALALYFRHNYIPAPYSIYEKVFKLQPGEILTIGSDTRRLDRLSPLQSKTYWSAQEVWHSGALNSWQGDERTAVDSLETILGDAVKSQMISDVPLGAFLSGGIDSSIVTALMQSSSSQPVKTFSIGFHEAGYNEAVFAKNIADYLGANHTELYVTDEEARDVIPLLPSIYDEPFADASQIPTYLVSKLAREQVTVSLSGDAGDELFNGYSRYIAVERLWRIVNAQPRILKQLFSILIRQLPVKTLDVLAYPMNTIFKSLEYHDRKIGNRLKKYAGLFSQSSRMENYRTYISYSFSSENPVLGGKEPTTVFSKNIDANNSLDYFQLMALLDILTYLPDDILVKVDRASMAVALEARVPFLDHRVVEFASAVPTNMKIRAGSGKWILKEILKKYIPLKLTERPKMGFAVPVGEWLRGPLKNWCQDLLNQNEISDECVLDANIIQRLWKEHLSREWDRSPQLWGILMFRSWLTETKGAL